jgi:hypothetical protein
MMVRAMLATGVMASTARHELLLITPIITGLIFIAARQANRQLDGFDASQTIEFPPHVAEAIERATSRLPAGDARRLLGDVVREARPLFSMKSSAFDASKDNEARMHAGELIVASCDTALKIAQLDDMLEVHTSPDSDATTVDMSLLNRLSSARDLSALRLRDAAMALRALYASGVENGTPASDRVAELVADLRTDVGARTAAKRELDDLLGPPTLS